MAATQDLVPDDLDIDLSQRQDPRERQQIRQNYRQFLEELKDQKEDLVLPASNELNERLMEAEDLFKPVLHPREGVYDSIAMSTIATLGRQKAQNLHTDFHRFQAMEFAEKLKSFLGGQGTHVEDSRISALGWTKLGEATQILYQRNPPFTSIAGSIERDPTPMKSKQQARKRNEKDEGGKETVPKQLDSFKSNDMNEATTEEVERVLDILKRTYISEEENPLCFFEFILDPDSYGQTVENLFHVSFLVRDNLASIFLDGDGLPVIKPEVPSKGETSHGGTQNSHQAVISLTPEEWKNLIETFKVEFATITPRR